MQISLNTISVELIQKARTVAISAVYKMYNGPRTETKQSGNPMRPCGPEYSAGQTPNQERAKPFEWLTRKGLKQTDCFSCNF